MKKKLLITFVVIAVVVSIFAFGTVTASAATSGYYTYTVSNGKATITGCNTSISGDVTIPSTLGGYPVTSIDYYAFSHCSSLTSVVIPDSVTSVGSSAFRDCSSLTSVVIPDSVTSIGDYAFYNCSSLTKVNITDIASWCGISFSDNSANPLYYAKNLYLNNNLVTNLVIPDTVTTIGSYAFYNCSGLTSVVIPDSVTSVGSSAFRDCSSLTSVVIPDSVTSIGNYAFYNCSSLTSVDIGDSVTSIGSYAFYNCSGLTSVVIPDSVTGIGQYAFYNCSSLTSMTLPFVGASATATSNNYFGYIFGASKYNNNGSYVPSSLKKVTISKKATKIDFGAFYGCINLESITLPFIGEKAAGSTKTHFSYIFGSEYNSYSDDYVPYSLKEVIITDGIIRINSGAFYNCIGIETIKIPSTVTTIEYAAFEYCTNLKSITIPSSVTSIGSYAFNQCKNLNRVNITDLTAWCNIEFDGADSNPLRWAKKLYLNNELVTKLEIPNGVTAIRDYAFYGCSNLTGITIPNSVTTIGEYAFGECSKIKSLVIPDSVTSIGCAPLAGWTGLEEITLPFVGESASGAYYSNFGYLFASHYSGNAMVPASLKKVVLTEKATRIDSDAFYDCNNLTTVVIPKSVTKIGLGAFEDCNSLISLTIPFVGESKDSADNDYLGYIFGATHCFYNDDYVPSSLREVIICEGAIKIGYYAFSCCSYLTNISIPDTVTRIEGNAFAECYGLKTIHIPKGVTHIGSNAFYLCSNLETIVIPEGVGGIWNWAFAGCTGLKSIVLPKSITFVEKWAFSGCSSLKDVYYAGSWNDWSKISIETSNDGLLNATKHYYYTPPKNGWVQENGIWYFYENDAKVKNAWRKDSMGWCFLDSEGKWVINSFVKDSTGKWAYITPNGYYYETTDWVKYQGHWYYLEDGYRVENDWRLDSIGWCFLGDDGRMLTNTWKQDSTGWCYIGADGYCLTGKQIIGGKEYTFDENGVLASGINPMKNGWHQEGGVWYYYESGIKVKNEWRKDSIGWCYLSEDGSMVTNDFVADSMGLCYIGGEGYMLEVTDWQLHNDQWYYLQNGYAVTNDWRLDSKGWCYLGEDGAMLTSTWFRDSVGWCYIDENGYCLANGTYTVDGHEYTFDADGRIQGEPLR